MVPVEVVTAVEREVPVRLEALGTVTPIASVAIKARARQRHRRRAFPRRRHGAGRAISCSRSTAASSKPRSSSVDAVIAGAKAQLRAGRARRCSATRELIAKNATTQVTLNNAQTQVNIAGALGRIPNRAMLENLKVQLSYCTIRAPISGRISAAMFKVGNFVRPADTAPLATINQIAPIYVTFACRSAACPSRARR